MKSTIKPGDQVVFTGLPEPTMTVLSVNGQCAKVEYYDEFLKKKVRLPCDVDGLRVVAAKSKDQLGHTKAQTTSAASTS